MYMKRHGSLYHMDCKEKLREFHENLTKWQFYGPFPRIWKTIQEMHRTVVEVGKNS